MKMDLIFLSSFNLGLYMVIQDGKGAQQTTKIKVALTSQSAHDNKEDIKGLDGD